MSITNSTGIKSMDGKYNAYNEIVNTLQTTGLDSLRGKCNNCNVEILDKTRSIYCDDCGSRCRICLMLLTGKNEGLMFCRECDKDGVNFTCCRRCCENKAVPGTVYCNDCMTLKALMNYQKETEINDCILKTLETLGLQISELTPLKVVFKSICEDKKRIEHTVRDTLNQLANEKEIINPIYMKKLETSSYIETQKELIDEEKEEYEKEKNRLIKNIRARDDFKGRPYNSNESETSVNSFDRLVNLEYKEPSQPQRTNESVTTDENICPSCSMHVVHDIKRTIYCHFCETLCRKCLRPLTTNVLVQTMYCENCDTESQNNNCYRCHTKCRVSNETNYCSTCKDIASSHNDISWVINFCSEIAMEIQSLDHVNKDRVLLLTEARLLNLVIQKCKSDCRLKEKKRELKKATEKTIETRRVVTSLECELESLESFYETLKKNIQGSLSLLESEARGIKTK